MTPPYPVRHAGLWRCCIETAQRTEPREPEQLIECAVCRAPIVWTGTWWAWLLAGVERDEDGAPVRLWL